VADDIVTPDDWNEPEMAPLHVLAQRHDHKGHSEEMCIRCGWIMGHMPLNCQNDDSPHVFPSQQVECTLLMDGLEYAWAVIANGRAWDEAHHDVWEQAKFCYRDEHWHPALDRNREARRG
jgi:hypothetical protein